MDQRNLQERNLDFSEIKILCWMCDLTRRENVFGPFSTKLRKTTLSVKKRNGNNVNKRVDSCTTGSKIKKRGPIF